MLTTVSRRFAPDFTTESTESTETDRNHGNPGRVRFALRPPTCHHPTLASLGLAKPWRWCAAGKAGGLPTRGRKASDPDPKPFPSGLCGLCALCGETPDRAGGHQVPRESWLARMRVRERGRCALSHGRAPLPPRFARRPLPASRGEAKFPDARDLSIPPTIQTVRCSREPRHLWEAAERVVERFRIS